MVNANDTAYRVADLDLNQDIGTVSSFVNVPKGHVKRGHPIGSTSVVPPILDSGVNKESFRFTLEVSKTTLSVFCPFVHAGFVVIYTSMDKEVYKGTTYNGAYDVDISCRFSPTTILISLLTLMVNGLLEELKGVER